MDFLDTVEVLDLDLAAAEAAAVIWASRPNQNEEPDVGDVLIAGTALAAGYDTITDDEGFAARRGRGWCGRADFERQDASTEPRL